jgi:hypothetical protein
MKLLLFILLAFFLAPAQGQVFKAGAAKRSIDPDHLIPISGGMGKPVMPTGKAGLLSVRALVVEKGDTRVAFVSIDNLGWPSFLGDQARKLVSGIKPENILIGATHAHSAPDAYGFPDEQGKINIDEPYLKWCVVQMSAAINEAVKNLEPAILKTAVAEAKGKIAYNYYAEKLYDPRCGVIQVTATTGKNKGENIATLVNYATHPEILGTGRGLLSPDLCGPLYDRIETRGGGMAIFMNSAQGGMVTADTRIENGKEANDWNECIRIGNLLADEALRIVKDAAVIENADLYCAAQKITFPVESPGMRQVLALSPFVQNTRKEGDKYYISSTLNLVNIGKAQIITIPGEALPNIGFYLKRKMKTTQPFIFGLTNDSFGYMLTKVDFNSFERYNYVSRRIRRRAEERIRRLSERRGRQGEWERGRVQP